MILRLKDKQDVRDCLQNVSFSDSIIQSCVDCFDGRRYRTVLATLKNEREVLRNRLMKTQIETDTLDYLISKIMMAENSDGSEW